MYPLSVKQTYLDVFNSSASSAAVPGLATDPFSILLGARSTPVTAQTNCLPSSQGGRVLSSGRFPSVLFRQYGYKILEPSIELSACFTKVLSVVVPRESFHASGSGKTMKSVLFDKFTTTATMFLSNFCTNAEG